MNTYISKLATETEERIQDKDKKTKHERTDDKLEDIRENTNENKV